MIRSASSTMTLCFSPRFPPSFLLKVAAAGVLRRIVSDTTLWGRTPLVVQLLYIGLVHSRLEALCANLSFAWITTATAWTIKAMRKPWTRALLAALLLGLPVVLLIVGVAAALGSPLVPLFGLPIFIIGFPRPRRFVAEVTCGGEPRGLRTKTQLYAATLFLFFGFAHHPIPRLLAVSAVVTTRCTTNRHKAL